jgi:hypothetical protein
MADQFFSNLAARFEAPPAPADEEPVAGDVGAAVDEMVAEAAPDMASIERKAADSQKWIWILAAVAVLAILLSQVL